MPKYFIEVQHDDDKAACDLVVSLFKSTGSHFLTNADFGCEDGEHKAWINIEAESREDALYVVPPQLRDKAKVIKVEKFALDKIDATLRPYHL